MKLALLTEKKSNTAHAPTVAVDLDGTLTDGQYTGKKITAKPRPGAKKALESFNEAGYKIIIFTVRGDKKEIRRWLDEHEIPYDHINENPSQPKDSSGKVIASAYVDDRAVDARESWTKIARRVHGRLGGATT